MLDGLIEAARAGRGAALMLTGESGIGKTALLDHAAGTAAGLIVTRVTGVESETELPYAALHQLCGFLLEDGLDELPPPRRDALRTVFGLRAGSPPELFRAGLAVRDLLARAPTVCLVDDAQWLDRESAQVLGFVARRLRNHPVTMVFAAPSAVISDISEMSVRGVRDADARALLAEVRPGPLDERVRDQILAEARGNPGALLGRSDVDFRPRIERLTPAARLVLLVAAADPTGDAALVGRAVRRLGRSLADADDADLLEVGGRVAFRHPAARTAAYRAATPAERRRAHGALAEETDPRADPDRRAWHRGQSLVDPDEDAAAALAANADRARERGGLAAAGAFLARAAELTAEPGTRADRELAAAVAHQRAGAPRAAAELLTRAASGPPDERRRAGIALLRGRLAPAANAPALLLAAAHDEHTADRNEQTARGEAAGARDGTAGFVLSAAFVAALVAGPLAVGVGLPEVAAAARDTPDPLLAAVAASIIDGGGDCDPCRSDVRRAPETEPADLRRALRAVPDDDPDRLVIAVLAAHDSWDDDAWSLLADRLVRLARADGALALLPLALTQRTLAHLHAGEFTAAAALAAETAAIGAATGDVRPAYANVVLTCWRGRPVIDDAARQATALGEGRGLQLVRQAAAVLHNGLGHYAEALTASAGAGQSGLPELVEAAARSGEPERAAEAVRRLSRSAGESGTAWARGIEARSRALISDGDDADKLYREAIDLLTAGRGVVDTARAHLMYGEWLRREGRRVDARAQLRTAHEMLARIGAEAFAERARRELLATGATVRKRSESAGGELTPQERQIVRRVGDGRSNAEIGAELFLSARTVEWHLHKIFGKLGITSRRELRKPPDDG